MSPTLQFFLIVSAALFCIGLLAALSRRHAIFILIGIEMMLAAAGSELHRLLAFWPATAATDRSDGRDLRDRDRRRGSRRRLALVIAVYRHYRTTNVDKLDQLKG